MTRARTVFILATLLLSGACSLDITAPEHASPPIRTTAEQSSRGEMPGPSTSGENGAAPTDSTIAGNTMGGGG